MNNIPLHRVKIKPFYALIIVRLLIGTFLLLLALYIYREVLKGNDAFKLSSNIRHVSLFILIPFGGIALILMNFFKDIPIAIEMDDDKHELILIKYRLLRGYKKMRYQISDLKIIGNKAFSKDRGFASYTLKILARDKEQLVISNYTFGFNKQIIKTIYRTLNELKSKANKP